MTSTPFIRQVGLTDVRSLWEIEKLSFPSPWSLWVFLIEYSTSTSTILVAGPPPPEPWETWGYIVYWMVAEEMHILNLAVHPTQRRRGIARALVTAALEQARSQGAGVAWLEVRPSNAAALALYQSFGFEEIGVRPGYYSDNREDALLYAYYWEAPEPTD